MQEKILITFFNKGLRSYIEVDLCAKCPRNDNKGCCGFYSPIFYPTDLVYLLENKPDLVEYILSLPDLTVLDSSITINNSLDSDSYKCRFHTDKGCLLDQSLRESICRHFVCPGIAWEKEEKLADWQKFFNLLTDYEIDLNNKIAENLKAKGLSLRNFDKLDIYFQEMMLSFYEETEILPDFFYSYPLSETFTLYRTLTFGKDWPL